MKDKIGIVAGIIIAVAVLVTLFFYLRGAGDIDLREIVPVGIVLVLIVFAMYILWDKIKNLRKGLPAKDERLITINYKAGYYGFIAAIQSAVGGPLIADIFLGRELEGHQVMSVVVIVSGLVFVTSYLYMALKGNKT